MIEVKNLTKSYGDFKALDDISFELKKGEIVGFLGPNGAGKTTTMKILTGFLKQDEGKVSFESKSIKTDKVNISQAIGYLPENNPLYENLRVDEFLLYFAKLKQFKQQDELRQIAERCGIEDKLTKPISTLSKGYKQRVGLAKALIAEPTYLILDEPTTGLDPNQKQDILELIREIVAEKAVLFSSHILSEVKEIADRLIIINHGEIVAEGSVEKLLNEQKGQQLFVVTNAPKKEFTKALEKVRQVEKIHPQNVSKGKDFNQFTIDCEQADHCAEKIFDIISKNKWKLRQLTPQTPQLEDIFKQLTQANK